MAPRLLALALCALAACAHDSASSPSPSQPPAGGARPAPPPRDLLAEDVAQLSAALERFLRAQDEALWTQWLTGTLYDAEALRARFPQLFRADAVVTVRQARTAAGADPRALGHLEGALAGLQISAQAAASETALANLEASLTFTGDDRDVPWRELSRTLANEPSALKRKAVWAASHRAAERLGALLDRRDAAVLQAHRALGLEPDTFSELRLELDLDQAAELAETLLKQTDAAWRAVLERRAREELKLPLERLSRADLPRLMRPASAVEAAFPKELQAARARAPFEALGLLPAPGFEVVSDEARVKGVLPLPLLVRPYQARLAVRPRPGLRPFEAFLNELGRLAALREASGQRFEYARLGAPVVADVTGALFEGLVGKPEWLAAAQLSPEAARAAARAWTDAQLFELRKASALLLADIAAHDLGPAEAQEQWRALLSRALALPVPADEAARWKLELEAGLLPAHALRVHALAAWLDGALEAQHGPSWWKNPSAAQTLRKLWAPGTALPPEAVLPPLNVAAAPLVAALTGQPAPAADGGTWTPVPFPTPQTLAADAGAWAPVAWGSPRSLADGGT